METQRDRGPPPVPPRSAPADERARSSAYGGERAWRSEARARLTSHFGTNAGDATNVATALICSSVNAPANDGINLLLDPVRT